VPTSLYLRFFTTTSKLSLPTENNKKLSTGYQIYDQSACYYLTFQVVEWADVFSRKIYKDILIDSLQYCMTHKQLNLHAYVIMSNHMHLMASATNNNLSDIVRDFKRHTSKKIIEAIYNEPESRRKWLLQLFSNAASEHSRNEKFQVWTHENHAVEIFSHKFIKQKMDYIHQNPVRAGIVEKEEDYLYSSAKEYLTGKASVLSVCLLQ
jgi:REP element-mobilizing transposase RayT